MVVKYTAPNILGIGAVEKGERTIFRFMPGINIISKEIWDSIKTDAVIAHKLKKKQLVVLQAKDGNEIIKDAPSPKLIAEMYDMRKLQEYASGTDKKLAKAAKDRLDELNAPELEAEEEAEEGDDK